MMIVMTNEERWIGIEVELPLTPILLLLTRLTIVRSDKHNPSRELEPHFTPLATERNSFGRSLRRFRRRD
jgi:hypothetical protein